MVDIKTQQQRKLDFAPQDTPFISKDLKDDKKTPLKAQLIEERRFKSPDMYGSNWYGKNKPSYDLDDDTSAAFTTMFLAE